MSPRFMLIGQIGAGKTTLFNGLFGKDEPARKTQVMEFEGRRGIDTPGEYFSHPRMYHALITVSAEVDRLLYVHPADVLECRLPPGLLQVYAHKTIDAIVTKVDLPQTDLPRLTSLLREAGVQGQIFPVSMHDRASLDAVRTYLLGPADVVQSTDTRAPGGRKNKEHPATPSARTVRHQSSRKSPRKLP